MSATVVRPAVVHRGQSGYCGRVADFGKHNMPSSASLTGLFKWLRRPDWAEPFEEMLWLHMGATCEALDLEQNDIEDLLGGHYAMTLWGCAFEDFLTRALEPDGRNIVDDYLKRRGWKRPRRHGATCRRCVAP